MLFIYLTFIDKTSPLVDKVEGLLLEAVEVVTINNLFLFICVTNIINNTGEASEKSSWNRARSNRDF